VKPIVHVVLALLAAALSSCSSFLGWQHDPAMAQRGPVPTRTQQPIKLTYLAFRPRSAQTQVQGELAFAAISQYSNIFVNGFSGTQKVVFDAELWRNSAIARYGLAQHTDVEIELPFMYATSGFLDQFIESYHKLFGFPDSGREKRPDFVYEVDAFSHGKEAYSLEGNHVGIGDIPIVLTQQVLEESEHAPAVALRAGVELPTGSESRGFGNGKFDFGGGVIAQRSFGRWTMTGGGDYVVPGNAEKSEAADVAPAQQYDGQLGIEYRWNDRSSLLGGLVFDSAVTNDIHLKEIDKPILSLDLGIAWDAAKRAQVFFGLTEDVIADSGPDFTVNFVLKCGF
jgi:hypothetical protein